MNIYYWQNIHTLSRHILLAFMFLITIYQNKLTIEPLQEVIKDQLNLIKNTYSVRLKDKKRILFFKNRLNI